MDVRYTDSVRAAMRVLLADGPGSLVLDARSLHGFGHQVLNITREQLRRNMPANVLDAIDAGWGVRAHLVPRGARFELPCLFAIWRTDARVTNTQGSQSPPPEFKAGVRDGLARLPEPSVLLDGSHEVCAIWRLDAAIRSERTALLVLSTLAKAAGGVEPDPDLFSVAAPLAGVVRSCGASMPPYVRIAVADGLAYELSDLTGVADALSA